MKFEKNLEEHYTSLKILEEKLDSRIAPALKGEFVMLNTEGIRNIILNLEQVKYVDSSGLSAILVANRLCGDHGGVLVLCCLNDAVQNVMQITKIDSVLNIIPTEAESVEAIIMAELEGQLSGDADEEALNP
jgi:anti-sigma B factor antagonist